ncbi:MAG: PKD domain-containing protein [Alphaproteobacteria bacterium]
MTINATAPIADAAPDQVVAPGEDRELLHGRSVDLDGDIGAYDWDFRDGDKASGREVSHSFAEPGDYQVRLQVRDDGGQATAIATDDVNVRVNAPPVSVPA